MHRGRSTTKSVGCCATTGVVYTGGTIRSPKPLNFPTHSVKGPSPTGPLRRIPCNKKATPIEEWLYL